MTRVWVISVLIFALGANAAEVSPSAVGRPQLRVALVLDRGGKNDNSFNSAAYFGSIRAQKELGIYLKYVESPDIMAFESIQRRLAKKNFDLIVAIGFGQADGLKHVAKQFPNQHFLIIDGVVNLPNVNSILFLEHEGSYLVGALAGHRTKTQKVGFIGGMDIPLIRRFEKGYSAGAHKGSESIQVLTQYIGITADAWNNPSKAKEIALSQYNKGADIIFVAAGASGTGVFDAAEETHHWAIGVDSNQNWMKPHSILTSMVKKVDVAVFEGIQREQARQFRGGVENLGLKSGGIDYALDQYNKDILSATDIEFMEKLKKQIVDGSIVVPDYYKLEAK